MALASIGRFIKDKRGNFATMAIFGFPVMFASVALSLDVMQGLRLKTELQNANDTAVMFAARSYQVKKVVPTTAEVTAFLKGNFKDGVPANVQVTFDQATNTMTLSSDAATNPLLMNYFSPTKLKASVVSKATLGVSGILEFALALDTTGSMNDDGKMAGLKTAAKNFVKLLFDKQDSGADVRGAIVPFAEYVNVGVGQRNAAWLDVPADIDTRVTKSVCKMVNDPATKRDCVTTTVAGYTKNYPAQPASCWYEDGFKKCWSGSAAWSEWIPASTKTTCKYDKKEECKSVTTGELFAWNGCVSSRPYPDNLSDPYANKKFPGVRSEMFPNKAAICAEEIQPLTKIRSQLVSKIDSLKPEGQTYIPDGIMWGMRTLTSSLPYDTGRSAPTGLNGDTQPLRKALVVMTDGQNTIFPSIDWRNPSMSANNIVHEQNWFESPQGSGNWEQVSGTADGYTLEACNQAKAAGIEVYTISFGNAVPQSVKTLLAACASKPTFFNHASDTVGLTNAFGLIADELLAVRMVQ